LSEGQITEKGSVLGWGGEMKKKTVHLGCLSKDGKIARRGGVRGWRE